MCAGVLPPKGLWGGGQGEKPALSSSCHPLAPDRRPDRLRACLGKRPAPLCSADFLLLPERQHREQGREGREPGRAAAAPPRPQIVCWTQCGGGEVLPCGQKLLRRLSWRFLYRKPHGPLSSGKSFLGVFHAAFGKGIIWVTPASPARSVPCPEVLWPGGKSPQERCKSQAAAPAGHC